MAKARPPRVKWGDLSKERRDRAARAGKRYGLSRDAVRGRYNRGTYNPLSKDPVKNKPREVRRYIGGGGQVDWRRAALDTIRYHLSDYYKFNDQAVIYYTQNMTLRMAEFVATASEDELIRFASIQPIENEDGDKVAPPIGDWGLPPGFTDTDVQVYVNGEWHNPFWYH
jgi:hypothetical protein